MTSISLANVSHQEELMALWGLVFGDSRAYAELFFEKRWPEGETLVLWEGSQAASMLTLLPLTLCAGERRYTARYIYGVATHPQQRSKGYSGRLLEAAHEHMQRQGVDASLLVPAEESLFEFYGARGYETEFFLDEGLVTLPSGKSNPTLVPASLAELLPLRDARFAQSALYARWDEAALRYQDAEAAATGGETLALGTPARAYALCYPQQDKVLIKELVTAAQDEMTLLCAVAAHYGQSRIKLRRQATGRGRRFAMTRWYRPKGRQDEGRQTPYLSLVLD